LIRCYVFFLEDYATKAPRPAWIEHDLWDSTLPIELSYTEKFHFLRALCRLQTHANIRARPEEASKNDSPGPRHYNDWGDKKAPVPYVTAEEEAYRLFFGIMPPWEHEEMGCVWTYLKTKYDPIYKEISDGLHDLVKKHGCEDYRYRSYFAHLPQDVRPPLRNIESIRGLEDLPDCTGSLAAIGPEFLYRLLHRTPLLRRDMVLSNADFMVDTFIGNRSRMFVGEDEMLPLRYPADRHAVRDFEQFWSTLPSTERPNLGWKRVHLVPYTPEQTLEDALDLEGKREYGWNWGHAIWDDERLKIWKAPILED